MQEQVKTIFGNFGNNHGRYKFQKEYYEMLIRNVRLNNLKRWHKTRYWPLLVV